MALAEDKHFLAGLNVHAGQVTNAYVAEALGYAYMDPALACDETAKVEEVA